MTTLYWDVVLVC